LAPFLSKVIGIDVSEQMVAEFNRNANSIGLADKMIGYKADLLADTAPEEFSGPEYANFDVVAVSMALHHFEHPDVALQRLASRLKKGGSFMIIDLIPSSGHDHGHGEGHGHSHGHHGHGHGHDQPHCHDHAKKTGHDFGDAAHTVKRHGFSRDDMENLLKDAGLSTGFDYELIPDQLIFKKGDKTHHKTVFIARAQRA
jgi:SAM-dependent methyltransferase